MARLTFRQGIVRHGKSPAQSFFLQQASTYVDLLISPDSTIITFADGEKDYLFTESVSVATPWGPLPLIDQDYWLYWELNKITGTRTYGSTTITPTYSPAAPNSPTIGEMWFDTSIGKMQEYSGTSWIPVLRVFACRFRNNQFFSPVDGVSLETNFTGSQIGAAGLGTRNVGALAFDTTGKPIINQSGKFFTTEDTFTTGVPTGASLKINNILITAQASENLSAHQVVVFDTYDKIQSATPFDILNKVYGIVEENIITNSTGNVLMEGIVFNEAWDFTDAINHPTLNGEINDPIYVTASGTLTTDIILSIPGQVPLGAIIGKQSILFRPGLYGLGNIIASDHGALVGLTDDDHLQYYDQTRGDVRYYPQVIADITFAPITHAHVEADVTDLDKYTQSEIDGFINTKVSTTGDTMTGILTLAANPTNPLDATPKQYVDSLITGSTYSAGSNIIFSGSPENIISTKDVIDGGTIDALTWNSEVVNLTTPADNQVLLYDSAVPEWKNGYLTFIRNDANTSNVIINTTTAAVDILSAAEFTLNSASFDLTGTGNSSVTSSLALALNSTGNTTITAGTSSILLNNATDITLTSDNVVINPTAGTGSIILKSGVYDSVLNTPTLTASTLFSLPTTTGTVGQVLSTNGSGVTSWIDPAAGGGGSAFIIQDTDLDTYVEVGFGGSPQGQDSGSNDIRIQAGTPTTFGVQGGGVVIQSGLGNGANAGEIAITASYSTSDYIGDGGSVNISSGAGTSVPAGTVNINGGLGSGIGAVGGSINITAGDGYGQGANTAGNITITAGGLTNPDLLTRNGGDVFIQTQGTYASSPSSGNFTAGDIYLEPGISAPNGYINAGNIVIRSNGANTYGNGHPQPVLKFQSSYNNNAGYVGIEAPYSASGTSGPGVRLILPGSIGTVGQRLTITNVEDNTTYTRMTMGYSDPQIVPYDVVALGTGTLADNDVILYLHAPTTYTLYTGTHQGYSETIPTVSSAVFSIRTRPANKSSGWSEIGTFTFTIAGGVSSSFASEVTITPTDVLSVICTAANSIADVTIGLRGRVGT